MGSWYGERKMVTLIAHIDQYEEQFRLLEHTYKEFCKKGFPHTFGDFLIELAHNGMRDLLDKEVVRRSIK